MNIRDIPTWEFVGKTSTHRYDHSHAGHTHCWQHALSRRQLARTACGAAVIGAALGSGLWRPEQTEAHRSHEPSPSLGVRLSWVELFTCLGPGLSIP